MIVTSGLELMLERAYQLTLADESGKEKQRPTGRTVRARDSIAGARTRRAAEPECDNGNCPALFGFAALCLGIRFGFCAVFDVHTGRSHLIMNRNPGAFLQI